MTLLFIRVIRNIPLPSNICSYLKWTFARAEEQAVIDWCSSKMLDIKTHPDIPAGILADEFKDILHILAVESEEARSHWRQSKLI